MVFDVHIFVCNNQRTGSEKLSCGDADGLELVGEFKKQLKDLNTGPKHAPIKAVALVFAIFGPTVAIYPEGTFYVGVQKEDVKEIVQSHIINKIPVDRLLLKDWKK